MVRRFTSALALFSIICTSLFLLPVTALSPADTACQGLSATGASCGSGESELKSVINNVINILLFVVGVASVLMLIIGGIRYVVSGGNQQSVSSAKNTILYALIGLIVASLAYALVNFVLDGPQGSNGSTPNPPSSGPQIN